MALGVELHLDYAALGAILRSPEMEAVVESAALAAASLIEGAIVNTYVTDRAAASITIFGDNAFDYELLNGVLADAARTVRLEVNRR
jgi:dihydroxyacetone kinase